MNFLKKLVLSISILTVINVASASYNFATGRFLQRDPIGTVPNQVYFTPSGPKMTGQIAPAGQQASAASIPNMRNVPPQMATAVTNAMLIAQANRITPDNPLASIDTPSGIDPARQYQDGMNTYQYCRSDPANLTDPWGLTSGNYGVSRQILRSACDQYSQQQCCRVGVKYGTEEKQKCYKEADDIAQRYQQGILHYWETGPWYTKCNEYSNMITAMNPTSGSQFFSLRQGGTSRSIMGLEFQHWYVGVFHACNRQNPPHQRIVGTTSDGTMDPWSIGFPPTIYNRGYGDPSIQGGRGSDFNWQ